MSAEFEDGKDEGALRTIGEVAKALGIKTHVLRYWEEQFPGLNPLKRAGGRRYYRPDDIALIERIDALVNEAGYTLKGAKAALRGERKLLSETDGSPPSAATAPSASLGSTASSSAAQVPADLLPKLKAIRADLASALKA
jgi:DNA-binding transcriptional MerR regulator